MACGVVAAGDVLGVSGSGAQGKGLADVLQGERFAHTAGLARDNSARRLPSVLTLLLTWGYVGEGLTVAGMVLMVGGGRVRLSSRRSLRGLDYHAVSR